MMKAKLCCFETGWQCNTAIDRFLFGLAKQASQMDRPTGSQYLLYPAHCVSNHRKLAWDYFERQAIT